MFGIIVLLLFLSILFMGTGLFAQSAEIITLDSVGTPGISDISINDDMIP